MRGQPRYAGAQADQRDCRLYRFYVTHPKTGKTVLGYVGETARLPFRRLMEHIESQPWSDTIVRWEVDPQVFAGKDAVLAAERAAVEAELPLYNYEWNQGNPHRIPIPEARRQRAHRDAERGMSSPNRGQPVRVSAPQPSRRPQSAAQWSRAQRRLVGVGVTWAALAVVLPLLAVFRLHASLKDAALAGLVGPVVLLLGGWAGWAVYRSARPRSRRKANAWAAAAVVVGVLWLLWPLFGVHLPAVPAATTK